jgi:hypothetical protein
MKKQLALFLVLLIASTLCVSLSAQAIGLVPALASETLPTPAIHSRDQIRQRLAILDTLLPGVPYRDPPHLTAPYAAGSLNAKYIAAGLATLNAFRYLSGLPDTVRDDAAWNESAQYGAALLAIIDKGLDHAPGFPANLKVSKAFYDKGYAGTSTSNLNQGSTNLADSIRGYMDDSSPGNVDRLGHRRWVLSPRLDRVGFGMAGAYFALKVFSMDGSAKGQDYAYVAWPAVGEQPLGWFGANQAWSFSINPAAFNGGLVGSRAGVEVTLQRMRDKRTWSFSAPRSDGYFNVETTGFGLPFCVIFKPNELGTLLDGDRFSVRISGVSDGRGAIIPIAYDTVFFGVGQALQINIESRKPAKRTVVAASRSQGMKLEPARLNGLQATMGYVGPALVSFSWYVDSPDGILPIGIEINRDGIIHGPGETIIAPAGGITHLRIISTETGLKYTCFAQSSGWAKWGSAGDTIGFDDGTAMETISIDLGQ